MLNLGEQDYVLEVKLTGSERSWHSGGGGLFGSAGNWNGHFERFVSVWAKKRINF